jgi:hypothetical protein
MKIKTIINYKIHTKYNFKKKFFFKNKLKIKSSYVYLWKRDLFLKNFKTKLNVLSQFKYSLFLSNILGGRFEKKNLPALLLLLCFMIIKINFVKKMYYKCIRKFKVKRTFRFIYKFLLNYINILKVYKLKKYKILHWIYKNVNFLKKEIQFNFYFLNNNFKNLFYLNKDDIRISNYVFVKKKKHFNNFFDLNLFLNYKYLKNDLFIVDKNFFFFFFFFESIGSIDHNISIYKNNNDISTKQYYNMYYLFLNNIELI